MSEAFSDKYGKWAVVTGASSGIGAEFARQLGPSPTGLYASAGQDLSRMPSARFLLVEPAQVVAEALAALGTKRTIVVGRGNKIVNQLGRLMPRSFISRQVSEFVEAVSTTDGAD